LEEGLLSVVKLSFDSKSPLMAMKISLNPDSAGFSQRKTVIVKIVKHVLILELPGNIFDTPNLNSVISHQLNTF
jgi:hypothetical protein